MTGSPDDNDLDASGRAPLDGIDASILASARAMYERLDPVPDGLTDKVKFSITFEALNVEIARLQGPSELVGSVRAEVFDTVESLTFKSEHLTIVISFGSSGVDSLRLEGWIAPVFDARVTLRDARTEKVAETDTYGHFVFDDVAPRDIAIRFDSRDASGRSVVIPTFSI